MKKQLLSILTALTLCLTLLPTAALATNEPLDGTNGINITSSNMEDATVTGSATANAAEADITDEVDLTKDPGKDFSGYEAMLTTASGSVTYYETFAAASEAAQKNADSTIKLLKDVKAPENGLNFFEGAFIVDLNGKNLTGGYATLMLVPEKSSSQGSTAKVTLINTADNESTVGEGTMYAVQIQGKDKNTKLTVGKSNGTASNIKFLYKSTGTYTIDIYWGTVELYDGTYVAERSKVISGFGKNTALIIHGGSYTGATGAVYFDGSDLTIEGGEFKATNSDAFALVIGDERTGVRNVELSGGTFHGISAERSLSKLLKDGYSFKKADGSWLTETELAATSTTETVTVEEKPLKSLEVKINNTEVKDSSYSATINEKLTFTVETDPADANADVTWSIDDNPVNGSYTPDELGTHTLKCEATKEGYSLTKTVTIMVVDAASIGAASITKADGSVTAPAAKTDLVYNGEAQALITAGSSTTGTIQYKLNNGEYSTALPEATNAGTYTVSYKVVGDENHEDVDEASFSVTIGKAAVTVTASDKTAYVGGTALNLSKSEKDKDYTISSLFGEDTLTGEVTLKYDPEKPDMTKTGEAAIKISGTLANDNYDVAYADGKLTITTRPSSGGSSGGGSSTTKTETTNNPDGSTTKTETKSDGTVVETTTNKDGSTTKTETKKDGSSVTENKDASGSTATVKTDKNGSTEAEAMISEKAVADAKESGEAVKVPAEVKAGENSSSAPTVKVELPKNAGETKVEIPVKNVSGGTVAVIVHPDGTEEIVKDSLPTENGIQLTVSGNTTVKIMDNSKDFVDVKDHWAKDAIDFVSARELVNGIDAAHYAPDAATTRAQLWTILGRQNDADLTGGANWYEKAQAWSVANGISDGTNPNGTITRAQMVTMLWRTAGSAAAESKTGFTDVSVDSYYAQAVAWAVENGITTGVGGGRFDPNATCTRAQIATFLARSLK